MKKVSSILHLKEMPVSLAGVLVGSLLAVADYHVSWAVVSLVCLTAAALHIFRYGGSRWALVPAVVLSVMSVYFSFGKLFVLESLLMLLFAYFVMRLAAGFSSGHINRTASCAVLCFLTGPVAVFGAHFLCSHSFGSWVLSFPALSIGILCAAVTGAGAGYGKVNVSVMTMIGLVLMSVFPFLRFYDPFHYIFGIMIPIYVIVIVRMNLDKKKPAEKYQPALSLCLMSLSLLMGLGFVCYLF